MNIGGLLKNSMIDYPGKVSCGIFLTGCNFDCPYCHNPELARGGARHTAEFDPDSIYRFIEARKGFLDGVVISGGEPTLQAELFDLCRNIKEMGYPLKLDTNGSRPQVIKRLIAEGLVDYIAMDLKTDLVKYATYIQSNCKVRDIRSTIDTIMNSAIAYEFRTTCVKPIVTAQTIENISRLIEGARVYALQRFHQSVVLHPEFFKESGYEYNDEELEQLKTIAQPWVNQVVVR
ncbi:MAG: anaerobic ribonucleoside-triphosphate reductase activating protein [Deltaproteobacteria bacterium]|jgi:pyruvate formate lyase activating enzyme|nr:anaerobic ribonucleoside-triphosphate reductase activating protein [Deltaproteobacteria bacterium]MBW2488399.1 anaerobic ribonucleoside-triphosphate reductase activating protein [Deltaproteobacteria bacterium]